MRPERLEVFGHSFRVFLQVPTLKAVLVDGFDNLAQKRTEGAGDQLEFLIIRVVQQLLVHIPHEMDETLLLWTVSVPPAKRVACWAVPSQRRRLVVKTVLIDPRALVQECSA